MSAVSTGEKTSWTDRKGLWVGPRAGLDVVTKKTFLAQSETEARRPRYSQSLYYSGCLEVATGIQLYICEDEKSFREDFPKLINPLHSYRLGGGEPAWNSGGRLTYSE
jgi:hypothetical protein